MRHYWSLFLLWSIGSAPIAVESAGLPDCASQCLADALSNSSCAATNQTCICGTASLQTEVTLCVRQNCTIKEALSMNTNQPTVGNYTNASVIITATKNITATTCDLPVRDKSPGYASLNIALAVLSSLLVAQRFAIKLHLELDFGLDDLFTLAALIISLPTVLVTIHGTLANGIGKDVWTVPAQQVTKFGMYFYIAAVLYFAEIAIVKLAILFFYLRVFPTKTVRKFIFGTIAFDAVFGFTFLLVVIFQCKPVSFFWTHWDGEHKGYCMDSNTLAWVNAVANISLDIWALGIPLSQLRCLSMDWKKKIGVGLMFCVGSFVTIVSILRLRSLVRFGSFSQNPTWDYFEASKWTTIEIQVGLMCICMPSLRLSLAQLFPKLLGTVKSERSSSQRSRSATGGITNRDSGRRNLADIHATYQTMESIEFYAKSIRPGSFGDHDEIELVPARRSTNSTLW